MNKKVILTGIRPTGNLHLGHYFGTIENWVKLQDDYEMYIEIADVQALTDNFFKPQKVHDSVYELYLDLLSVGIDPNKATVFIQSRISEIAELTVFYSNLVTIARLYRNPTIKTEIAQKAAIFGLKGEGVTYGFLGYPVSQAADITAFNGEVIPVGEDQEPLVEQTREIVRKFNNIYKSDLIEPQTLLSKHKRIKGLDGNDKMGKSLGNAIYLCDDEETIRKKIMQAKTDPNKVKIDDKADPEVCMVYYYHELIGNTNLETVCSECKLGTRGCVACKKELIENMNKFLDPIRENRKKFENMDLKVMLNESTDKASLVAKENLKKIKTSMKIDYN